MKIGFRRLLLIGILALLLGVSCSQPQSQSPPTVLPTPASPDPPTAKPQCRADPPSVDPDRLLPHLEALNFERYQPRDRQRARRYLLETLSSNGWQTQTQAFDSGVNVVATRAGTDSAAETLLVVAHYDSVPGSPGADDNATGVAAALEVARLFGKPSSGCTSPRGLQIVLFDREEQGLLGSFAFTANPKNLSGIVGVVNLEMLGYACQTAGCQQYPEGLPVTPPSNWGDFLAVVGDQEHLPLLQAFPRAQQSNLPIVLAVPIPFKGVLTPDVLRSDHAPFWAKNIGAVMVTDTANLRNPNYHQPTDTPATIDRAFFAGSTQLVVNALTGLLNSPVSLATGRG